MVKSLVVIFVCLLFFLQSKKRDVNAVTNVLAMLLCELLFLLFYLSDSIFCDGHSFFHERHRLSQDIQLTYNMTKRVCQGVLNLVAVHSRVVHLNGLHVLLQSLIFYVNRLFLVR